MKEHEESKQQSYTDQTNDASLKSLEAVIECAPLVSGSISPYAHRSQDSAGGRWVSVTQLTELVLKKKYFLHLDSV